MSDRDLLAGELTLLALLRLGPMHGYEMVTFLQQEGLLDVCPMEPSTLYTYLRALESRDYVRWTEERVGLRPPRKVFALTSDGQALIDRWLRRPVDRLREIRLEFLIKVFFLGRQDPGALAKLLGEQVAGCRAYLAGLDGRPQETPFQRLVLASKRSAAEATLRWLTDYAGEPARSGKKP